MKRRLLYMALWMAIGAAVTWANVYAVDRQPGGGTIPPSDLPLVEEPGIYRVYCPVHGLNGVVQ